jgi:exportin-7
MNLTDTRIAQGGCEKLDLAILSFFEQFRKIYVGDQVHCGYYLTLSKKI